jgi:hypothetical protein
MSLSLLQNATAMAANGLTLPFAGYGGVPPYNYAVLGGGAGGTIGPSSGIYVSPALTGTDIIQVTDADNNTATAEIMICTPLELVCDIIQTQMGLAQGRVYLYEQKINEPGDSGLFIAIGILACKPFGNNRKIVANSATGMNQIQVVNMWANLTIDIISRGPDARDKKEQVLLALKSLYAQQQQELNSFFVAPISSSFQNLSQLDGAAIPYRFQIGAVIQYAVKQITSVPYFDSFSQPVVTQN